MKKIINTPQGTFELDLTNEEISQRQIDAQKELEKRQAKEQAKIEQELKYIEEQANKQSAINKLKALGLTDAEVEAFRGK